jgi:hypothetical protein
MTPAGHPDTDISTPAETAEMANAAPGKAMTPAARRALAEAEARRAAQAAREAELASQREIDGRGGLDPVRYQDWEIKGLTSDF